VAELLIKKKLKKKISQATSKEFRGG